MKELKKQLLSIDNELKGVINNFLKSKGFNSVELFDYKLSVESSLRTNGCKCRKGEICVYKFINGKIYSRCKKKQLY